MADEPKPISKQPTASDIASALKEHDEASDRVAVLTKYDFLADTLNKRAIQNSIKK